MAHHESESVSVAPPSPRHEILEASPSVVTNGVHNNAHASRQILENSTELEADAAARLLDAHIATESEASLGPVALRSDVQTTLPDFQYLPEYKVEYPQVVVDALGELYEEYNRAFTPLIAKNYEWETDYTKCVDADGNPVNHFVQIDMNGLPDDFLQEAEHMDTEAVKQVLRRHIFEIENSLAMYQFLERVFSEDDQPSHFQTQFRTALQGIREQYDMPIALVAATDEKYQVMKETEFGKTGDVVPTDEEVQALSGFDAFMSPEEFKVHIEQNGGHSQYLLYVRSSDPPAKLKKPNMVVDNPLLDDPATRKALKEMSLTINIDDPQMEHVRRINDTKEYMPTMGMGYLVTAESDLMTPEFIAHMANGKRPAEYDGVQIAPKFAEYLAEHGIDEASIAAGNTPRLRAKPSKQTYGCYGHGVGTIHDRDFRRAVRKGIKDRGDYIVQPEVQNPTIVNTDTGNKSTYIDRNFFAMVNGKPVFMGGFRSMMPAESNEAKNGRNHGSADTVWAEVRPTQS